MAQINLLPYEDRKDWDARSSLAVLLLAVFLFFMVGMVIINQYQIFWLKKESSTLQDQIEILDSYIEKMNTLRDQKEELESRLETSKEISDDTDFYQILFYISALIPNEVTLSQADFNSKGFTGEGEASNYHSIARFINNLQTSNHFYDVELLSTYVQNDQNSIVFKVMAKF